MEHDYQSFQAQSSSVFGATEFSKVTQLFCRLPLAALSCMTIDH